MDDITIKTYEELAGDYDRETAGFWDEFPESFVGDFCRSFGGPAQVLNVGSGPGRDGSLLYAAGLNVICLDASKKMVEMSKERGLLSVHGDFMHLPFAAESFDGAWAYTALLHVKKAEFRQAVQELARVIKQGGTLALGMIEGEGEGYRKSSGVSLPRLFSYYWSEELSHLLVRAGFEVVKIEKFKPGGKYTYLNLLARKVS